MNIDPGVITNIQTAFLEHINSAFATTAQYAYHLLYLFAALELVILGFAWMLQREVGWDKVFFKIIKIGIIFFIIQNYTWLMNTILQSFTQIAGITLNNNAVLQYVSNPAKIWQFGYNIGIHLLQLASTSNLMGLTMILLSLGMGILLVFGLLGIQMVIQIVGFYVTSFSALILLPFGALSPGKSMLDKAVQAVFQAGLRLMVLTIIIGMAALVWEKFQFQDLATTTNFNINQPLGLFFTALLFSCLGFYLPKVVSQAVGDFGGSILEGGGATVITTAREAAVTVVSTETGLASIQAATTLAPTTSPMGGYAYEATAGTAAAATISQPVIAGAPISGAAGSVGVSKEALAQASTAISKSISDSTVKKIKASVIRAVQEKNLNV